jgi:adenylate kinase family enzyme
MNKYKKHIILAGGSRCGKTTLAMKLSKLGFVHYKMDTIKRGIDRNFWNHYRDDWRVVSPHMGHLIKTIIVENQSDIVRGKEYYCIDTCHIYPSDLAKYNLKDTIIVFFGYINIDIEKKIRDIRKYDKKLWSSELSDDDLRDYLKTGIDYSKEAKEECEKYNIKFFDTGRNFKKVIKEAEKYILDELRG